LQLNCLGQSCGIHLGWCRFFIPAINIEPLVLLPGRAFAFAPLYKFVSTFIAGIVGMPFDMDKSDRSVTTPALYLG
jgi:hypothetical protein